jgi:hypothetical protein
VSSTPPPLFDRAPATLFRPLAASNHRRYWDILHRLLTEIWGDGGRSPGEEAPRSTVLKAIESFLVANDPWEDELETPIPIRAHMIYAYLVETGWLFERKRGVVEHVTIRPIVAQLFTVLVDFSNHEPEFLGSRVRSILLNLKEVIAGDAPGAYAEAARQAKDVIAHIVNTGCRIHDLMDELLKLDSTTAFVRGFFEDYLERVFIADYTEFRTHNHPLQHRAEILRLTIAIEHDANRRRSLIDWYASKQARGDMVRAEILYERDTRLLKRLREVEEQLRRLDDEIRDANKRAMVLFEYKMRSPGRFDVLIAKAIDAVSALDDSHIALPPRPMRPHGGETALASPRRVLREAPPADVDEIPPTDEELARDALRKRMNEERLVTPIKLASYVARHLDPNRSLVSDDLTIETINDLCCYQRLLLIALRHENPKDKRAGDVHLSFVPGMRVAFVEGAMTSNDYMTHRRFVIEATRRHG